MRYDITGAIQKLFGNDYQVKHYTTNEAPVRYVFVTIAGRDYRIDSSNLMVEGRGNKKQVFPSKFFVDCIRKALEKHFNVRQKETDL